MRRACYILSNMANGVEPLDSTWVAEVIGEFHVLAFGASLHSLVEIAQSDPFAKAIFRVRRRHM